MHFEATCTSEAISCSLGLSPDSNFDKAVADMVVDSVMDIRAKRTKYHFESDAALKVGNTLLGVGMWLGFNPLTPTGLKG